MLVKNMREGPWQFDLAKSDLHQRIVTKQIFIPPKRGEEKEATLWVNSTVLVKNFGSGQCWLPGTIVRASGPVIYDWAHWWLRSATSHQPHLSQESGFHSSSWKDWRWLASLSARSYCKAKCSVSTRCRSCNRSSSKKTYSWIECTTNKAFSSPSAPTELLCSRELILKGRKCGELWTLLFIKFCIMSFPPGHF